MQTKTFLSISLLTIAGAGPLHAAETSPDVAAQLNTANGLLRDGDIEGAMTAYDELKQLGPPSAELSYNHAVAQYRQGDVAAAAEQFKAVAAADDNAIAAKARFNLGNCDYVSALQQAEQDRPAAIGRLESAIGHYRSALAVDPSDAEARANIELAAQMIEKLREEEKNEQEQQQQQQQNDQDQQQQDQQQNQDQQQDGQQDQQDQQQSGEQDSEQQDDSQQQNSDQQDSESSEQSQEEQQESDQSSDQQSEQQQGEQQESEEQSDQESSASEEQQQDRSQQQQQQSSTQSQSKQQPSEQNSPEKFDEQDAAAEADEATDEEADEPPKGELSAAEQSEEEASDEQKPAGRVLKEGEMTEEEADKMLQAIRDRDMLRRLQRQATERNQHIPVDRDW
ncbi:hypothetical protein [Aeoliella sp.]|uniref:hypothetical protein n=1 Tax=Aeoliella sp. TaxID=2795800 RepID=UPI003CCC124E